MAQVDVAGFLAQIKLAVKLLEAGAAPARLDPDDAVLDALLVGPADRQQVARADVGEQVELLRPYVARVLLGQQEAKVRAAMSAAEALVSQLQRQARHDAGSTWMPLAPLAALTAIPAFKALRFETASTRWCFPRALLGKVLHSLAGCTEASARLETARLTVSYLSRVGRGQIVLLDQAVPDWETGVLRIALVEPAHVSPEQHRVPPWRHLRLEPPRHWLVDAAYALVDGLM